MTGLLAEAMIKDKAGVFHSGFFASWRGVPWWHV